MIRKQKNSPHFDGYWSMFRYNDNILFIIRREAIN